MISIITLSAVGRFDKQEKIHQEKIHQEKINQEKNTSGKNISVLLGKITSVLLFYCYLFKITIMLFNIAIKTPFWTTIATLNNLHNDETVLNYNCSFENY